MASLDVDTHFPSEACHFVLTWQTRHGKEFKEHIRTEAISVLGVEEYYEYHCRLIAAGTASGLTLLGWQKIETVEIDLPRVYENVPEEHGFGHSALRLVKG